MEHKEAHFTGAAGLSVYYQVWRPEGVAKALIMIAHGAAEHGARYQPLAEHLTTRGYAVAALDHPGHGRTEGTPGHVGRFGDYVETLRLFQQELVGEAAGAPRVLLGHSLGGLMSIIYSLSYQTDLAGCILSGPAIATDLEPGVVQLTLIKLLSALVPKMGALQLDAEGVSRDPEEVARYRADPLVYTGKLSARLVAELFAAMNVAQARAGEITLPILMLHGGEDKMTAPAGSELLHQTVSSTDKTLKIYPELYHEIFNEPEKDAVMADVVAWLDQRFSDAT
jgi:alpha-beta hydrolase superfamily lysophospholipase